MCLLAEGYNEFFNNSDFETKHVVWIIVDSHVLAQSLVSPFIKYFLYGVLLLGLRVTAGVWVARRHLTVSIMFFFLRVFLYFTDCPLTVGFDGQRLSYSGALSPCWLFEVEIRSLFFTVSLCVLVGDVNLFSISLRKKMVWSTQTHWRSRPNF